VFSLFDHLLGTLLPYSDGPFYSNTVIGTLAFDGWAAFTHLVERRGAWAV